MLFGKLLLATAMLCLALPRVAAEPPAQSVLKAKTPAARKVIAPGEDGGLLLHARDVNIHGKTVRYEPQPHKNTIGFWTKVEDWVSWDFEVKTPGEYTVEILQGCGKGSGGSTVDFTLGELTSKGEFKPSDQSLPVTVEDTGGFQMFVAREIGKYTFAKPGKYILAVRPKTKPGVAVMDLRQVKLTPVTK